MSWVGGLRLSLALQAAAVVLAIVLAVGAAADELINKFTGSCPYESCAQGAPLLVMDAALLFGGPAWWAVSGALRARLLKRKQLVWLVVVSAYLVIVGLALWTQARDHVNETTPLDEALTLVTAGAIMSTAVVSAVACGGRIFQLRRPTSLPL
jgi:hypothetical protein